MSTKQSSDRDNMFVRFYKSYASGQEERLRLTAYLFSMAMILFIMPLHFLGIMGMTNPLLRSITAIWIILSIVSFLLMLAKKIELTKSFNILCIGGQFIQSARIIILSVHPEWGTPEIMTLNFIVSYIILLQLVAGLTPWSPIAVTVVNIVTLAFARFYSPTGDTLCSTQMWLLFTLLEAFTCLMGIFSHVSFSELQGERNKYKDIQDNLLSAFSITQKELVAFLQVWKGSDKSEEQLLHFMENLDEQSQTRLVKAAHYLESEHKSDRNKIAECFPTLTETELKVAALVIKGKTKHEIAEALGKTDNNIGTVRINIRRKLGLLADINLKDYLLSTIK